MATIQAIREALAENLSAIPDLQVSPYILAAPTPPSCFVYPCGEGRFIEYDIAMGRGLDQMPFTVELYTGGWADIGAQVAMDEHLCPDGPRSIKAALESDKTLGGIVDDLHVTSCLGYRPVVLPHRGQVDPLLCATWLIDVYGGIT